jgi:hypothetical protein
MTPHLNPQQILALANAEYLPDAARHTAACAQCAAEVKQLTGSLELFRESVQALPEWRPRAIQEPRWQVWRWAAAVTATAALAAMFVISQRQQQAVAEEMALQDAALMDQLYHGTARITPASFERFNNLSGTEGDLP